MSNSSATGKASNGQPSYTQDWFLSYPDSSEEYKERFEATFGRRAKCECRSAYECTHRDANRKSTGRTKW